MFLAAVSLLTILAGAAAAGAATPMGAFERLETVGGSLVAWGLMLLGAGLCWTGG